MKHTVWCRLSIGLLLCIFLALSLTVYLIDPFQIYRLAENYLPPIDNTTQVYSNAGIVKNYPYDSAIVGTSVTENFRPTLLDQQFGGHFIKLCTSGGTVHSHAILMERAFNTHHLRRIVYGLDIYSLVGAPDKVPHPLPEYLYNTNPFDDVQYFLNRSVLAVFLPRCFRTWGQKQTDTLRDSMYSWAGKDPYGPEALYNAQFTPPTHLQPADAYLAQAEENLRVNLLPFITAHPDTEFIFFFPPYSAAEWSTMESRGTLEALLSLRLLCYERLSPYPNEKLYDFTTRKDWVLDLSNYKDTTHYGIWINDAIGECIAKGEALITAPEQIETNSRQLHDWADSLIQAGKWIF